MAIRSQLRLVQLTGSLDDGGALVGPAIPFAATSLQGSLDEVVTAIKRIHGATSFQNAGAGEFSQAIKPDSPGGQTIGTTGAEWGDLFLGDDKAIKLGLDQDVTLTHVPDAGLLLNSSRQLQFGDDATNIAQSADGVLELSADGSVLIDSPILDLDDDGVVISFGADDDVSLTHVADAGLLLNAGREMQFRDSGLKVFSSADAQLDISSDGEVQIAATTNLDIDAADVQIDASNSVSIDAAAASNFTTSAGALTLIGAAGESVGSSGQTTALAGDLTVAENATITGNLTVNGTTTTIDTANMQVEDKFIALNFTGAGISGGNVDTGIFFGGPQGDSPATKILYYDVATSRFKFVSDAVGPTSGSVDVNAAHLDLETGDHYLGDGKQVIFGDDSDASIKYDEASSDKLQILAGGNGALMSVSAGDIVLGHSGLGAAQLGDVLKVAKVGSQGHVQVSGSITSFGTEALVLSSSGGTDLKHQSAKDLKFRDVYKPSSWGDADGIKLASNAASWTSFESAFGEVSLLDAIVSAQGGAGTLQKRTEAVTGSGYPAGHAVPLALDLDALTTLEVAERVDVFVNGQLMVSGAEVSGNGDYNLVAPVNGSAVLTTFEFALVADDIVQAVVR